MEVMDAIFNRRTIRKYKHIPVPEEIIIKIVESGQRAPSACSFQTYSIILVKNEKKRKILWESCGKQNLILEAPVTLVMCADIRKILKMMKDLEFTSSLEKGLGYRCKLLSIIDTALVAQNMTIAAESFGLGSIYIGGALANQKVIDALVLPKGVLPISLLCLGYPNEDPPLRPRMPLSSILFIDEYKDLTKDEMENSMQYMTEKLKEEKYYFKYEMGPSNYT